MQQEPAHFFLGENCFTDLPLEQHIFEALLFVVRHAVGLCPEQVETMLTSAGWFLADLALSPDALCKRGEFGTFLSFVKEWLLLADSSELRRRELVVDALEPSFPLNEWRSRTSQHVSSPRAIRDRQIHPKACRVAA